MNLQNTEMMGKNAVLVSKAAPSGLRSVFSNVALKYLIYQRMKGGRVDGPLLSQEISMKNTNRPRGNIL